MEHKYRMNAFINYHPVVNFTYFTAVILFAMIFMHPACLGISLTCSFLYAVMLNGKKAFRFHLFFLAPMLLIMALVNPVFNHEGATILWYLPGGNPLTMESVLYGVAAAMMLASVLSWFSCYNVVMTSDKFIYLFGRVIPSLSLMFSMILRFVPRFKAQLKVVANARKSIGQDASGESLVHKAKEGLKILSVMLTWSLENAIETADSMKSRGYGLPGRSAYSLYVFTKRDGWTMLGLVALIAYILISSFCGGLSFAYFPSLRSVSISAHFVSILIAYVLLCSMPIIIEIREAVKWKS